MRIQDIDESLASALVKGAVKLAPAIAKTAPQAVHRMRQLTSNLDMVIARARTSSPQDMKIAVMQLRAELLSVQNQFPELAPKLQPAIVHIHSALSTPATSYSTLTQVKQILDSVL